MSTSPASPVVPPTAGPLKRKKTRCTLLLKAALNAAPAALFAPTQIFSGDIRAADSELNINLDKPELFLEKAALRRRILALRRALPPEKKSEAAYSIAEKILYEKAWQTASCIAFYLPLPDEVSTFPLLESAWRSGKTTVAPIVQNDTLVFGKFSSRSELVPGPWGISQPALKNSVPDSAIHLILVPGIAFDLDGYRLGYGGGFYDRYFQNSRALRWGLAFDFQLLPALPRMEHDVPVDKIFTELRLQ